MKTKVIVALSAVSIWMSVTGSDCINSPFIAAVNLDPIASCFDVNPGDGTWNDQSDPIVIEDLIDDNFKDKIVGFRLYDIRVRVTDDYPDGTVSGTHVSYSFDSAPFQQVITGFGGPSSAFKGNGVSLLDPQGLVTYDQTALEAFVAALNNQFGPPQSIVLSSAGSGPMVPAGVQVCVDVFVQADGEVE